MADQLPNLSSARQQFLDYLQSQQKANATILAYGKDIEQLNKFLIDLGKSAVDEFTRLEIEAFIKKLVQDGFTLKSVSRKLNSIKTFCRFLKKNELIKFDPSFEISHPKFETKAPRILSKMEYRALRDSCREDLRTGAIVELFLQTGIKISELANLKLENIKNNSELLIKSNNNNRNIPLNKAAKTALERYLQIRVKTADNHVFVTKTGKPLLIRNIRTCIDRYFKLAGIECACVNDLRHTFIAQQLANGSSLAVIAKLVGHKRLATTEKYLGLIQEKPVENIKLEEL